MQTMLKTTKLLIIFAGLSLTHQLNCVLLFIRNVTNPSEQFPVEIVPGITNDEVHRRLEESSGLLIDKVIILRPGKGRGESILERNSSPFNLDITKVENGEEEIFMWFVKSRRK